MRTLVVGTDVDVGAGAFGSDLEQLWHERRTAIVATVAAISGDRDAAIDAVDETFTRGFQHRKRVEAMASATGWLLTVALNEVRRGKRRGARRRVAEASVTYVQGTWIEPSDPRIDLWAAVKELPERERTAIALRYLADLTEPEIARTMGIAVGTAGATLTSARQKLARRLQARASNDQEGTLR